MQATLAAMKEMARPNPARSMQMPNILQCICLLCMLHLLQLCVQCRKAETHPSLSRAELPND